MGKITQALTRLQEKHRIVFWYDAKKELRGDYETEILYPLATRHIVTDQGWKISLDRGLDIFQRYEMNDAFALANRMQRYRACKAFEVTYLRVEGG